MIKKKPTTIIKIRIGNNAASAKEAGTPRPVPTIKSIGYYINNTAVFMNER